MADGKLGYISGDSVEVLTGLSNAELNSIPGVQSRFREGGFEYDISGLYAALQKEGHRVGMGSLKAILTPAAHIQTSRQNQTTIPLLPAPGDQSIDVVVEDNSSEELETQTPNRREATNGLDDNTHQLYGVDYEEVLLHKLFGVKEFATFFSDKNFIYTPSYLSLLKGKNRDIFPDIAFIRLSQFLDFHRLRPPKKPSVLKDRFETFLKARCEPDGPILKYMQSGPERGIEEDVHGATPQGDDTDYATGNRGHSNLGKQKYAKPQKLPQDLYAPVVLLAPILGMPERRLGNYRYLSGMESRDNGAGLELNLATLIPLMREKKEGQQGMDAIMGYYKANTKIDPRTAS